MSAEEGIMRAEELMSRRVLTIMVSDSCREAVARMARAKVRHLPVLDGQGTLVGVVTDRDLRHLLFGPGVFEQLGIVGVDVLLETVPVAAIMSAPVLSVGPAEELAKVARLMAAEKVGSLPVVEGGRVIGIVTETDVLRQMCRVEVASPECAEIIVSYP